MTVSYNIDVSQTSSLVGFVKLLFKWRGSIWKNVTNELICFGSLFLFISYLMRSDLMLTDLALCHPSQAVPKNCTNNRYLTRDYWVRVATVFDDRLDYIPLTFMLGFFVTIVVKRWGEIFANFGWIDNTALVLATYLRGTDEKSRIIRRNVIRYLALTQVLVFRDISMRVRKRFPTLDTVVAAHFMEQCELDLYDAIITKQDPDREKARVSHFVPIHWAFTLLYEARVAGKLSCDLMLNEIIKHITEFRVGLARLLNFDWVPIPLVYPQVVFLAVRSYFLIALIARQSVLFNGDPTDSDMIFYMIPFVMSCLQYIFYVGWMKVAESLMNPLGEDDDDFECNYLIDRNLAAGLIIVDDLYSTVPPQQKDVNWNGLSEPLYSAETAKEPQCPQIGSVAKVEAKNDEIFMMPHKDTETDINEIDGDQEKLLLRRGISIVSVNRQTGSRTSLNSRKSRTFFGALRRQFSRDNRMSTVSRPNRLSQMSLNTVSSDIDDQKLQFTPEDAVSPARSPAPEVLTSVPEEDEEHQQTRTKNDLRTWMKQKEQKPDENDPNTTP